MADHAPTLDLSKYIEARMFGDRPHVRGRRVPVATIAYAHAQGWDVARLTHEYTLSEAQVLSALLYYEEHRDEIDSQEQVYQAELDDAQHLYGKD